MPGASEVDWIELWRELSTRYRQFATGPGGQGTDPWQRRAQSFDEAVKRKTVDRTDQLTDFVVANLRPDDTVLDVDAGTGRFSVAMARVATRVTAVEPSPSMAAILQGNVVVEGLANVDLVQTTWEDAEVTPHDVVLCSHAMYASPDLVGFIRKVEESARRVCFLLMRVPSHDGVLAELSRRIYGHPYDSPNFVVGYNALYSMGIYANVVMEPAIRYWVNDTQEEALERARRHLRLVDDTTYDGMIRDLLAQSLAFKEGQYHWPDGMRSALVWWEVT